jgi:hypothetical protein
MCYTVMGSEYKRPQWHPVTAVITGSSFASDQDRVCDNDAACPDSDKVLWLSPVYWRSKLQLDCLPVLRVRVTDQA